MKLFDSMKSSFNEAKAMVENSITATKAKMSLMAGMAMLAVNNACYAAGAFNPNGAIKEMAGYATAIVSGVGIIYAIIAVFNWVSAIKQEDSERASKSIINVFIAGLLILIGPITAAIINALGGDASVAGLG